MVPVNDQGFVIVSSSMSSYPRLNNLYCSLQLTRRFIQLHLPRDLHMLTWLTWEIFGHMYQVSCKRYAWTNGGGLKLNLNLWQQETNNTGQTSLCVYVPPSEPTNHWTWIQWSNDRRTWRLHQSGSSWRWPWISLRLYLNLIYWSHLTPINEFLISCELDTDSSEWWEVFPSL